MNYWEEDISKQIEIASLLMVFLSIPQPKNKLSCLMASSSSRSSSSMKGRSEGLRVLTLLEFVDGFDSNKLFSSCFCDCDCDGVWADCGLCDSTPPEEYLSVCNFSSSIWSIWKKWNYFLCVGNSWDLIQSIWLVYLKCFFLSKWCG